MNKILEIKFGSELYGTSTPQSDTDIKSIYLPTAREIVLHSYKKTICTSRPKREFERNNKDDVDLEIFSLDRYLELLMQGQTLALDILFSPEFRSSCFMSDLRGLIIAPIFENREKLLTKNVSAFIGYARMQASRYGIKGSRMDALKRTKEVLDGMSQSYDKLRTYEDQIRNLIAQNQEPISLEKDPLIEIVFLKGPNGDNTEPHLRVNGRSIPFHATVKYAREVVGKMLDSYGQRAHKAHLEGGVDWKALSHAVRVNSEALELLTTGNITFPRPDKELLLKVKLGELPYEQVAEMIERGLADLYEAQEKSTLREKPDKEWADGFIYDIYSRIVKNGNV